jgi:hypothetical protein
MPTVSGSSIRDRNTVEPGGFETGVTRPTEDNTGPDLDLGDLDVYAGPDVGDLLTISTSSNTSYTGVDFGTTRIKHTGTGTLTFNHCKWTNTRATTSHSSTQPMVDSRGSAHGQTTMYRCEVDNASQADGGNTGVMGWKIDLERCKVQNFTDNLGFYVAGSPGADSSPLLVNVLDTWLGPMSWFYNSTSGIVHPSDTKTHNDGIQFQGGYGWTVRNTTILAEYSTTVGTGTPGSGSDNGWTGQPTYAAGVSARYTIVEGSGTYSSGTATPFLGGSIAGIMVNTSASKGYVVDAEISHCYGSGGSYWLNCGVTVNGTFGEVFDNLIQDNQRVNGYAIAIETGVPATVTNNYYCDDDWVTTGELILRRNA